MAVNFDIFADFANYKAAAHVPPKYTHVSDKRVVISLNVLQPPNTATLPEELMIVMEEALECGVPVQVQFEITPTAETAWTVNDPQFPEAPGSYIYLATINSVKARIKPGTQEFVGKEEEHLDHIIEGTEDEIEEKKRSAKRLVQAKKLLEEFTKEANRFTGLEIS